MSVFSLRADPWPQGLTRALVTGSPQMRRALCPENGDPYVPCDWGDAHSELKELSKRFKGTLFTLRTFSDDKLSACYYRDGKSKEAKVVVNIEPF